VVFRRCMFVKKKIRSNVISVKSLYVRKGKFQRSISLVTLGSNSHKLAESQERERGR
jgi:hypothetical protein